MIINPYPVFGDHKYAYLNIVLLYNGVKTGYDLKINSYQYPDYVPIGPMGGQSGIRHQGKWSKYTSLLTPGTSTENLAFEIQVPIREMDTAEIWAELTPWEKPAGHQCLHPVAWFHKKFESVNFMSDPGEVVFEPETARYGFAKIVLSNIFDPNDAFHVEHFTNNPYKIDKNDTDPARFFQSIMEQQFQVNQPSYIGKIFCLRVKTKTEPYDNMPINPDFREDTILIEIKQ
jgi:hypothetical protein